MLPKAKYRKCCHPGCPVMGMNYYMDRHERQVHHKCHGCSGQFVGIGQHRAQVLRRTGSPCGSPVVEMSQTRRNGDCPEDWGHPPNPNTTRSN